MESVLFYGFGQLYCYVIILIGYWHHHVVLLSVRVSVCPPDCNAAHTGVEVEVDKMSTAIFCRLQLRRQ